jgi:hypothetical protein
MAALRCKSSPATIAPACCRLMAVLGIRMYILVPQAAADSLTTDLQKAKILPLITQMTLIFTDQKQTDVYLVPLKSLNRPWHDLFSQGNLTFQFS